MVKFKIPNKIFFFGGGFVLLNLIKLSKQKKIPIVVFTEKRFLNEYYNNKSLSEILTKKKIKFFLVNSKNFQSKIEKQHIKGSIGISYRFSFLFSEKIINNFENRLVNLHSQVLPNFRGKGGFTWNILSNSNLIGSTIHLISSKVDKGPIILSLKKKFKIENKNYDQVEKNVIEIDIKILKIFINKVLNNQYFKIKKISQNDSFYFPSINSKKNAWLDLNWSTKNIISFINSFSKKYSGAMSNVNNKKIWLINSRREIKNKSFHPFQVGIVYKIVRNRIYILSRDGSFSCSYFWKEKKKLK